MTVLRSNRAPNRRRGGAGVGESYLNMLDAGAYRSTTSQVRAAIDLHRATRPCTVCATPMVDGACVEHGTPAEDRGDWLWAR